MGNYNIKRTFQSRCYKRFATNIYVRLTSQDTYRGVKNWRLNSNQTISNIIKLKKKAVLHITYIHDIYNKNIHILPKTWWSHFDCIGMKEWQHLVELIRDSISDHLLTFSSKIVYLVFFFFLFFLSFFFMSFLSHESIICTELFCVWWKLSPCFSCPSSSSLVSCIGHGLRISLENCQLLPTVITQNNYLLLLFLLLVLKNSTFCIVLFKSNLVFKVPDTK